MQKTVLVTGCSSGIGLESALDLTRQGFRVLAACRKAEDVARMQDLGLTGILLIWMTRRAWSARQRR